MNPALRRQFTGEVTDTFCAQRGSDTEMMPVNSLARNAMEWGRRRSGREFEKSARGDINFVPT